MKKFFQEFGAFIKKGNVLDLAVAIIIGTAFNVIVRSLVNDILMPIVGVVFKTDVSDMKWILVEAVYETREGVDVLVKNAVELRYGVFFQSIIDFLIIAFTIYLIVRVSRRIQKRAEQLRKRLKPEEVKEPVVVVRKPTVEELLGDIKQVLIEMKNDSNIGDQDG